MKLQRHWRARWGRATLLLTLAIGLLGPVAAMAAGPGETLGGIGVAPGATNPSNPLTKAYFIPTIAPGGTYSSFVIVTNTAKAATQVSLYVVATTTGATSGAVYLGANSSKTGAAAWVSLTEATAVVPADGIIHVPFKIDVPKNASPGDHLVGIAIQPVPPATPTPSPGSAPLGVTTITRSVMAILIQVPGKAAFTMSIAKAMIVPLPATHTASVLITLGDTGLLLGKPHLTVTLTGPDKYKKTVPSAGCKPATQFCGQLDTILPGTTIPYAFPWPTALKPGAYTISVVATSKQSSQVLRRTFHYTLASPLQPTVASQVTPLTVGTIPAWIYGVIGALVLLTLASIGWFAYLQPKRKLAAETGVERDPAKREAVRQRLDRI